MNPSPWLSVIGIGEQGTISDIAAKLVAKAEIIIAHQRHRKFIPQGTYQWVGWPQPFAQIYPRLRSWRGRNVVILASGDPMYFGIGASLTDHFCRQEMTVIPGLSAFSLAAARLRWPLASTNCITLHGRCLATISACLYPRSRILCLTSDGHAPRQIADFLQRRGINKAKLWVLENLGGSEEKIHQFDLGQPIPVTGDLHVAALALPQEVARDVDWSDSRFHHDGNITKSQIRAIALRKLAPFPGGVLWDIGAGSGAISIEWTQYAKGASAYGVEIRPDRLAFLTANREKASAFLVHPIKGRAPEILADLPVPDAIFLGGGVRDEKLIEYCWQKMPCGARLVAHGVTLAGEAVLSRMFTQKGGELCRIAISKPAKIGEHFVWRALAPITQWFIEKA